MTPKRGFCGIGIYHGKKSENVGTLMRSAFCFGADFIFTVGLRYEYQPSDTPKAWRSMPCYHYRDFDDLKAHLPLESRLVAVEMDVRARSLEAFTHPERAIYLLGAEDHGLPPEILSKCGWVVQVPHVSHCLNVSVAGSIVLHDRAVKQSAGRLAA